MATAKPMNGIALPSVLEVDNNDIGGLVDTEHCSKKVGIYRYQQLQFGLMRSEKALAIFAEHGLMPVAGVNGLHWVLCVGASPEAFRIACYHAWQACYADPELRPLFDQWKLEPTKEQHA